MEARSYPSLKLLVLGVAPIPDALGRALAAFETDEGADPMMGTDAPAEGAEVLPGSQDFSGGSVLDAWLAYGSFRYVEGALPA